MARKGSKKPTLEKIVEDLHPKQQAAISQEGDGTKPRTPPKQTLDHMRGEPAVRGSAAPFVALEGEGKHIFMDDQGRHFVDPEVVISGEALAQIKMGYRCLKCREGLFDFPFPPQCDACGYPIKERQIVDLTMEYKGTTHIGPTVAIDEYLEEQLERAERRTFAQKLKDGVRTGGGVLIPKGIRGG